MPGGHLALVVDDDEEILQELESILKSLGHQFERATNQEDAEALFQKRSFCYVLLDLHLPHAANRLARVETGFNILRRVRESHPKDALPVIVMTAHGKETEICTRAFKLGATDYITKPFDQSTERLEDKIEEALQATCEERHVACPNVGGIGSRSASGRMPKSRGASAAPENAAAAMPAPSRKKNGKIYKPVIKFVGKKKQKLCLLEIDGRWAFVTMTTFRCFWRLAVALLENPSGGWLNLGSNGAKDKYRALKEVKEKFRVEMDFQSDGCGKYRLPTVPEHVQIDLDIMRSNYPRLFEQLPPHVRG